MTHSPTPRSRIIWLIIALTLVVACGFLVRGYGRNWDRYTHMHPDERMLMMVADRVSLPDRLYPDFFNYGTLPIYVLKGSIQLVANLAYREPIRITYGDALLDFGRLLSSVADMITTLLVGAIAFTITRRERLRTALFGLTLYTFLLVFPIQNSHFFVVDTFLTLFLTGSTYFLLRFAQEKKIAFLIASAVCIGCAIASKFTAVLFIPGSIASIIWALLPDRGATRAIIVQKLVMMLWGIVTWGMIALTSFFLTMPYAFLAPSGILTPFTTDGGKTYAVTSESLQILRDDIASFFSADAFPTTRFLRDIREQTRMNRDAYVFPYTLQYVGTTPYLYHLKNIFVWGAGPSMSIIVLIGAVFMLMKVLKYWRTPHHRTPNASIPLTTWIVLMTTTYGLFFLIIGASAVKFMRYMLPLYPLMAIAAAYGFTHLLSMARSQHTHRPARIIARVALGTLLTGSILWSVAFLNVYTTANTRVQATEWILSNIPLGQTIAVEHWDDRVPIHSSERYRVIELPLYDRPDDAAKWRMMNEKLAETDYIILASNRLSTPLPKLTDCAKHGLSCYPLTARYYEELLAEKRGFRLVAEFTGYPHIGPFQIPDDEADESFTVYDHPHILIFQKTR